MQFNIDPRQILGHPFVYTTYQKIVGGYRARKLFVEKNIKAVAGQKILDIGCGPGDILDFLPDVDYIGIDLDANYIQQAQKKYGKRGHFRCASVDDLELDSNHDFDIVIAAGVLHHLTDQQCLNLFKIASKTLKPNGRFISFDGCYIPKQNKISAFFLNKDRGQYIRHQSEYEQLAKRYFSQIDSVIDESYFYIPYTSIIMDCKNI